MILILLLEIGGFIWKFPYLNSFVTCARIYQICCCSNGKTGAQLVTGKCVTVETELTWHCCSSLRWVCGVKKPCKTSNSYSLLYSYLQCISTERGRNLLAQPSSSIDGWAGLCHLLTLCQSKIDDTCLRRNFSAIWKLLLEGHCQHYTRTHAWLSGTDIGREMCRNAPATQRTLFWLRGLGRKSNFFLQ